MKTQEPLTLYDPAGYRPYLRAVFPVSALQYRRAPQEDSKMTQEALSFLRSPELPPLKDHHFLLLENVPGLLSHDKGRTFATILGALDELGYDVAWQVLSSKDFGVPQSRKRVYIIGYLREQMCRRNTFFHKRQMQRLLSKSSLGGTAGQIVVYSDERSRHYSHKQCTGGFGGKTGLYDVALPIKGEIQKRGYSDSHIPATASTLPTRAMNTRRGRVGEKIAHTVTPGNTQGYFFIDMNAGYAKLTDTARCIYPPGRIAASASIKANIRPCLLEYEPRAVLPPDKETVRQQGRRIKEPNEPMFTLTVQDRHGILRYGRVRKLTPRECWRLAGLHR